MRERRAHARVSAGPKHQSLVVGNAPRHRGVLAGLVVEVYPKKLGLEVVEPSAAIELKPV